MLFVISLMNLALFTLPMGALLLDRFGEFPYSAFGISQLTLGQLAYILTSINSQLNIAVYALRNKEWRFAIANVITCGRRKLNTVIPMAIINVQASTRRNSKPTEKKDLKLTNNCSAILHNVGAD